MSQLEEGPVVNILSGTDVFIASLVELGTGLDEMRLALDQMRTAISVYEREMMMFRAVLSEVVVDGEAN